MKIDEEFFEKNVKGNLFVFENILFGVFSHGEHGLISQEIGIVDNKGKIIDYFYS